MCVLCTRVSPQHVMFATSQRGASGMRMESTHSKPLEPARNAYTVASGCAGVPGVVCVISSVLYYWQRCVCYVLRLIMAVCVRCCARSRVFSRERARASLSCTIHRAQSDCHIVATAVRAHNTTFCHFDAPPVAVSCRLIFRTPDRL